MICMLYNTGKNIGGEFCEKISMGEDVCARVMSPQFLSVAAASRTQQEKIIIMICTLKQKKSHSTNNARLTKLGLLKNLLNNPNYSISLK